ncbi:MAG: hypothetical protein K2Y12_02040 [Chitinophagaceae bacterium]|nr:hypothetical protein [Chitinophagaceae bacterium]
MSERKKIAFLFDKKIASGIDELISLIDDVYGEAKKKDKNVVFTSTRDLAYLGFNFYSKTKNSYLFFGMYYHVWSDFGYPICLTLESKRGLIPTTQIAKFKEQFSKKFSNSGKFIIHEDVPMILFGVDYLLSDCDKIYSDIEELYLILHLNNE